MDELTHAKLSWSGKVSDSLTCYSVYQYVICNVYPQSINLNQSSCSYKFILLIPYCE